MKKRWVSIALIGCLLLLLTGCGNAIPDMTDEQMSMVTEYAAGLLLKYDADYEPLLLDDERLAEEEEIQLEIAEEAKRLADLETEREAAKQETESADSQSGTTGSEQEDVAQIDPAEFLELSGLSVSYNGVDFQDAYPESGDEVYFAVNASDGCKLAVVHLTLVNTGAETCDVDILNKNAKFKVSFNDGEYHSTMLTMLEDDFSSYVGTLAPGESADTVLLVDLKEEECNAIESLKLYIKYQGENTKTALYP